MQDDHSEDHDRGLTFDLATIADKMIERRRALAIVLGAGALAIAHGMGPADAAVGPGGPSRTPTGPTGGSTGGKSGSSSSSSTSSTSSSSTTSTSSGSCVQSPAETSGPYPADGTNTSSGSTSDILTQSGIVRSDIRSSFISSTTTATGVEVQITLTLVNSNSGCAALQGYAVYFWQCDASGEYSLYTAASESYLRGVQVTNSSGQVTFTTIFPGCYSGRWPHMHIEIYKSQSAATSGKNATLTTQLAMPKDIASAVYSGSSYYSGSTANLAKVSESTDLVFASSSTSQLTQQTPTFTGSVSAGYTATATIGVPV